MAALVRRHAGGAGGLAKDVTAQRCVIWIRTTERRADALRARPHSMRGRNHLLSPRAKFSPPQALYPFPCHLSYPLRDSDNPPRAPDGPGAPSTKEGFAHIARLREQLWSRFIYCEQSAATTMQVGARRLGNKGPAVGGGGGATNRGGDTQKRQAKPQPKRTRRSLDIGDKAPTYSRQSSNILDKAPTCDTA